MKRFVAATLLPALACSSDGYDGAYHIDLSSYDLATVAVGTAATVRVKVRRESPTCLLTDCSSYVPATLRDVFCEDDACSAPANVTVDAPAGSAVNIVPRRPGPTRLHVHARTDDGHDVEDSFSVTFAAVDRLECRLGPLIANRPVLVGVAWVCSTAAYDGKGKSLRVDPQTVDLVGDAIVGVDDVGGRKVFRATAPGAGRPRIALGGREHVFAVTIVAREDVAAIELRERGGDAGVEDFGPAVTELDVPVGRSRTFLVAARLSDGVSTLAPNAEIDVQPANVVTWEHSNGRLQVQGRIAGAASMRVRYAPAAEMVVPIRVTD